MGFAGALVQAFRRRRIDAVAPADAPAPAQRLRGRGATKKLVDPRTGTFWARGTSTLATLVEADADVSDLSATAPPQAAPTLRPRANPAFSEALFVELMRARQFRRAYDQLAPDCRNAWGDADHFCAAQRRQRVSDVQGVSVKKVRYLPEWRDPGSGAQHREVAELEVEYTLDRRRHEPCSLARTVHLIGEAGQWRSVCYPASAD